MIEKTLQISVLGSPGLALDGAPVAGLVYSRSAALVYYLAATRRAHTREALAGLLWPDSADEQARKNLRDLLADLRRAVGPYLAISRQTAGLAAGAPVACDLWRFEDAVAAARRAAGPADEAAALRDAVAAYGGDLLDGLYVAQAEPFEEWMLAERERLRHLAAYALHALARRAAVEGDYLDGVGHAARLIALDPLREESHRQLMLLLALSGQRSAALAQYEALRRLLDAELGAEPADETAALHEQIVAGAIAAPQPAQAAPARPARHTPPAPLVSFVGREAEVALVLGRLRAPGCRLLTIAGPGGVGKTTLALHVAHRLASEDEGGQGRFAHGVAFVALSAVEGAGDALGGALAVRVADELGLDLRGPQPPLAELADYLRAKELLLVLDNFEQILPAADAVVELLQRAPDLAVLVTSRARLSVRGEQVVELDGLQVPDGDEEAVPSVLDRYDALRLFRQAAEAAQPRFAWTATNQRAAAQICRLVDGLPLGIELAASLARLLPCAEIARELGGSLSVLRDTRRDAPLRHRSLQAVFGHSWALLAPDDRRVLRRLTVFRGGFTRAAAEAVCGPAEGLGPYHTIAALASLADASLLRRAPPADDDGGEQRYHLLEVVRQCTAEQPFEPEEGEAAGERHSRYYLGLVERLSGGLLGGGQQVALAALHVEIENIRAAWGRACARGDAEALDRSLAGMFHFYEMRSWFQEGGAAFAAAAEALAALHAAGPGDATARVWGRLLARQGWFSFHLGRRAEAGALLRQSLELLRPLGRDAELVFPLCYLSAVTYHAGDYGAAVSLVDEALALSLRHGDRAGESVARTILGQIATIVGDYAAARAHCEASLRVERALGNRWGTVFNLIALGEVALALGEHGEARRQFQESLEIRHAFGDRRGVALCLTHLGTAAAAAGDLDEAARHFEAGLGLFVELGSQAGAANVLCQQGYAALGRGDQAAASRHFRQALAMARDAGATPQLLAAVAGLAETGAGADRERALALAALVEGHPAASRATRARGAALRAHLAGGEVAPTRRELDRAGLDAVVADLLAQG